MTQAAAKSVSRPALRRKSESERVVARPDESERNDGLRLARVARRTIVVHAPSLKFSGARHVAQNIIHELGRRGDIAFVHALVPAGRGYERLASEKVRLHFVPRPLQFSAAASVWDRKLRRLVEQLHPDAVLNLANIAVAGVDNQFVLLHWPHPLHMTAEVAHRLPARERLLTWLKLAAFRRRLHHARRYFVQTKAGRDALLHRYGLSARIMPNAVSLQSEMPSAPAERTDDRCRVLVFSHFYPHKNLEIVEGLARRVFEDDLRYVFVLTVDPSASRQAAAFLGRLRWAIELGIVDNRGVVEASEIARLYASSDVLLLPTLLESFSTTYVEAMHFGVPIVTSDRDFARSVCGDAACYVDPLSVDEILAALHAMSASRALRERLIANGHRTVAARTDWSDIVGQFMNEVACDLGWGMAQPR